MESLESLEEFGDLNTPPITMFNGYTIESAPQEKAIIIDCHRRCCREPTILHRFDNLHAVSLDNEPIASYMLCQHQTFSKCVRLRHWGVNYVW